MTAVYNRYRVLTTKVSVTAVNSSASQGTTAFVAMYADNVTSSASSTATWAQMPFSSYILLGNSGGGKDLKTMSSTFNIASVLGYKENVDDDLSALYTANPSQ